MSNIFDVDIKDIERIKRSERELERPSWLKIFPLLINQLKSNFESKTPSLTLFKQYLIQNIHTLIVFKTIFKSNSKPIRISAILEKQNQTIIKYRILFFRDPDKKLNVISHYIECRPCYWGLSIFLRNPARLRDFNW